MQRVAARLDDRRISEAAAYYASLAPESLDYER
jgi:cytochrome c553